MIVTCANCQTRYNLPDAKIPQGGTKVKCSKCSHVFKVEPPTAASLEDEVETLLDEETPASDTRAGDDFDETFDEVAAGERTAGEQADMPGGAPDEEAAGEPEDVPAPESGSVDEAAPKDEPDADEPPVEETETIADEPDDVEPAEETPAVDDLFDESDAEEAVGSDTDDLAGDVEALFGEDDDEDEPGSESDVEDDLFAEDDADDDLFGEDETEDVSPSTDEDENLFSTDLEEDGDESDAVEEEAFEGETDFGLDAEPVKEKPGKAVPILIVLLVLVLGIGAVVYFKAWTLVGLDAETLRNVPYIGKMFMDEGDTDAPVAPGESPAERVRKIELQNVKQYYVANEKTGNLFVVEGKAVNSFESAKERIKVEVVLYDGGGNVLTSQSFLCGNQLSQFQLQVQTRQEIEEGLASDVGILSNNTFVRPGDSVPFMGVFFQPPAGVKEYLVKVVDVGDVKQ